MASTNGVPGALSPVAQLDTNPILPSSAKRKRESSEPEVILKPTNAVTAIHPPRNVEQQVKDFVDVLKSHDGQNGILNRPLASRDSSEEPNAKRKKNDAQVDTISHRAALGIYSSMNHVIADIKVACSSLLEEVGSTADNTRRGQPSEKSDQIQAFKKKAEEILEQETTRDRFRSTGKPAKTTEQGHLSNGLTTSKSVAHQTTKPADGKVVLTMFGSAPGGKQLYSSLQEPVKSEDGSNVERTVRKVGLPLGITTGQIARVDSSGLSESKKPAKTLGSIYGSLTASIPIPKPSKFGIAKGNSVEWYQPTPLEHSRARNSASYFGQQITTGQWLDYNNPVQYLKRRKDKSTSLSGTKLGAAGLKDETDSLFKNAYSSFAPTKDDAAALISSGVLNRLWWMKKGEKKFEKLVNQFAIDEAADSAATDFVAAEDLDDILENFDYDLVDPALGTPSEDSTFKTIEEKETEKILQDISELLETLNSYQRNRNMAVPSIRGGESTTAPPPDEIETATYNTLKAQLAFMIAMLPPWAVTKLNSDQLGDLKVSTKLTILTDEYKGVMEDDEEAQRAKVVEMANRSRAAPTPQRSSSTSLYGNQYSAPRPAPPATSQYYSQTPVRPPMPNATRPPATAPQQFAPRPPTGQPYRAPQPYAPPTYPHQMPRPPMPQYQSGGAQYYSTPQPQNYGHGPAYGNPPMTAPGPRYNQQQSPSNYNQRQHAPPNGIPYGGYPGPGPRQPSPQKQPYTPQPPSTAPRPYGTPTPAGQRYYPQSQNGAPNGSPAPPQQQPVGASGFHTVMTAQEQSTMMERQRAHLAQQQGTAQQQARTAAQASINGGGAPKGPNGVVAS